MVQRCAWAENSEIERVYHDQQWGIAVTDDQVLYEMLVLELMQAGLSWRTVLIKRPAFKEAFANWDYKVVATYTQEDINSLLQNSQIIRNKLKINAAIHNAQIFQDVQKEFGSFAYYLWEFVDFQPINNYWTNANDVPVTNELAKTISKDLKKRGFKFIGPTIIYSYLQAVGVIDDHLTTCCCFEEKKMRVQLD